jgi:hypothetical protein
MPLVLDYMARPKNILKTVTLTISTNRPLMARLENLVSSGLFGKSSTEAAERLIAKGIQDLVEEGRFARHSKPAQRKG